MTLELKMLQIVIMAGEVDIVAPKRRVSLRNQLWIIAMLNPRPFLEFLCRQQRNGS
jgi:hypothetical protein